jgi:hypothetical protein
MSRELGVGGRFFGKYRGKVENNIDPMMLGRVQVSCPAVLGDGQLSWATPSVPYAGDGVGIFMVPPVGAQVWVEFEAGQPDSPILGGCFWGTGEAPASPAVPGMKVIKTDATTLTINDLPGVGGFTLEIASPAAPLPMKITCDSGGIELSIGSSTVKLSAASVSINNGALEVI